MSETTEIDAVEQFEKLWAHVTHWNKNPSECMLLVRQAIIDAITGDEPNMRPLFDAAHRIGKHVRFVKDGTGFIPEVAGEFHVSHRDLELWSSLCLFGSRDYFPDDWHWIRNDIGAAIKDKRRWQTYSRYVAHDRVQPDHRRLLARLIWDFDLGRGDWVSLYVQGKRPFGDSGVGSSIHRELGWERTWPDTESMPAELEERCWELFEELQFAIHDVLRTQEPHP